MVRNNFFTSDVEAILNIPIHANGGEDFLAWAFEKLVEYTIKSAYSALVTHNKHRALKEEAIAGTSSLEK